MKKNILIALGLILLLVASCNRKAFVKKIVGKWNIDKYRFDGLDRTVYFDTTFREYTLMIGEDEVYSKSWKTYAFAPDSLILSDTLGYDSVAMVYSITRDTLRFTDTTITPHFEIGRWDLLNSEEDLQLRSDSGNVTEMLRILQLDKSSLKLRKGNEEFEYGK